MRIFGVFALIFQGNTLKKFQLLYGILLVFFASFAFRNAIVERDLKKLEAADPELAAKIKGVVAKFGADVQQRMK